MTVEQLDTHLETLRKQYEQAAKQTIMLEGAIQAVQGLIRIESESIRSSEIDDAKS